MRRRATTYRHDAVQPDNGNEHGETSEDGRQRRHQPLARCRPIDDVRSDWNRMAIIGLTSAMARETASETTDIGSDARTRTCGPGSSAGI